MISFEDGEYWKDIAGYENIYLVSNYGRIRSLNNKFRISNPSGILSPVMNNKGYSQVTLIDGKGNKKTTGYIG